MEEIIEIFFGIYLLILGYSCIQFWLWFMDLSKTKQIELKDFIFKEKNNGKKKDNQ